ncbi:MAG: EamA family transporter [Alphaproteobacteria bacterium]|nr:EamA family transporter [Alphaproteobacteria bacterium]
MKFFALDDFGKGVALTLIAATCFGVHPILAALIYQHGGDVTSVNLARVVAIYIGTAFLLWRRGYPVLPARADFLKTFLPLGLTSFLVITFYMAALTMIEASLAVVIVFTYPMLIAALTYLFNRGEFSPVLLLCLLTGFAGVALVVGRSPGDISWPGVLLAFGAACACAANFFVSARVMESHHPLSLAAFMALAAAPMVFGLGLVIGMHWPVDAAGWAMLLTLAAICFAGMIGIVTGIKLLGALRFSIIMKFEPLVTLMTAWAVLGETLGGLQLLGAALLIGALFLVDKKPALPPV